MTLRNIFGAEVTRISFFRSELVFLEKKIKKENYIKLNWERVRRNLW